MSINNYYNTSEVSLLILTTLFWSQTTNNYYNAFCRVYINTYYTNFEVGLLLTTYTNSEVGLLLTIVIPL